jgi:hypothetical protein
MSHSQIAVRIIGAVLTAFLLGGTVLDAFSQLKGWPGIADRLQSWTNDHPVLSASLAGVVGALLGHFFFWSRG